VYDRDILSAVRVMYTEDAPRTFDNYKNLKSFI